MQRIQIARPVQLAGLVVCGLLLLIVRARAEPVLDRILSGAQVTDKSGCALLRIDFNIRIRYLSHFPVERGDQLSIKFAAIDRAQAKQALLTAREAIPAPASTIAAIRSIEFDATSTSAPELLIIFKHQVTYKVAAGADFQSLVIAIAGPGGKPCAPVSPSAAGSGGGWQATILSATLPPAATAPGEPPAKGKLGPADRAAVTALMDRAREALGAGDQDAAIKALTRVLGYPKSEVTQEATELQGLAYQRKGDIAQARTIFTDYLARFAGGEDAQRVRQRLISLETAPAEPARKSASRESHFGQPGQPGWVVTGSLSQTYMLDQGTHSFIDPSLPPQVNQAPDENRVLQNDLLSNFDVTALWGNQSYQSKFRFSGALDDGLSAGSRQLASIAGLEFDTTVKDWNLTTKLGRQTLNTDGVLGRFDGGLLSWNVRPGVRIDTVAGSPVALRRDMPFKDGTYFVGGGVDFASLLGPIDTTFYGIEQRTGEFIDRRAVGTELRYADTNRSAFATVEYDIHSNMIDLAIVNGSWTFADKSTFTAAAEHRTSPQFDTRNALIGQTATSLTGLLAFYNKDEIYQLAKDRSSFANTASLGFSRPLGEHYQVSLDASWFDLTATPASGGVDANPDSGNQIYVSGQFTANDMLKPSDFYLLGLRFANSPQSNTYVADLSARYPISQALRLNPRLRVGFRDGSVNGTGWEEYSLLPSLKLDYQWTRDFGLELESGAKLTERLQGGTRDNQTEYFVTVGYRYDFNAEGGLVGAAK